MPLTRRCSETDMRTRRHTRRVIEISDGSFLFFACVDVRQIDTAMLPPRSLVGLKGMLTALLQGSE